ncbi:MAG: amino acid permease [Saprospiraceae bacterium]|nr:amino acid permease [Saprospiraceae bacterium]MCF8248450.1 amino acid permease [Saprospiraceae bacterium]MCF8281316.1 amino acid permease [Bacteroidales bacterium]MCF8309978.1 amino acid permease [Saprospiraceae bacterium]MCF8438691.1 amino acid permease [Saprospiraceae bacterium]
MDNKSAGPGELLKYFGLGTGIILIISSIIGSGVYKKVASMAVLAESPEIILLAWVLAGLVTLLGVLSLAEIAMLMPESGGSFVYLKEIYGEKFGYAYGWASFACIQSASTAAISYVFAQSLNAVFPLPILGGQWETLEVLGIFTPFANLGVKLAAVGLIILLSAVNYTGVRKGGGLSNIITIIVVVSLFSIIFMGLTMSGGSFQNLTTDSSTYPPAKMGENYGFMKLIFGTMLASFWAYEGWINIGFVGDEIKNPQRNIPRILIFGILIIMGIYLLVNMTYLYVMPIDEMIVVANTPNSVAAVEVIRKFGGVAGAFAISVLIVITTAGCTNSTILTSARIYYAMAKKGLFFKSAAYVHPKYKVPTRSLTIFAVWSSILVFSGTFDQLTDMLVFAQFIFYALVIAGVFVLRKRLPNAERSYKVIGYPVVPALFILFCIGLVINTLIEQPREAGIGLFLIATGIPFYYYFKKNNFVAKD